jgi:class 3 adenylate cyclase
VAIRNQRRSTSAARITLVPGKDLMATVGTQYAKNGDVRIAYQVFGEGSVDLAWTPWLSGLEVVLEQPLFAAFVEKLATFARVVRHDRRATGLSDRAESLPDLETQSNDLRAVLDAVRSPTTVLFGSGAGFGVAAMFAATQPQRTSALVLYGAAARAARAYDYAWGNTRAQLDRLADDAERGWGTEEHAARVLAADTPSMSQDPAFVRWFAKAMRHWVTPGTAAALLRQWHETDVRPILGAVQAPTLVLARECENSDEQEYLASLIPRAEFRRLPGQDSMPWVGDSDAIVNAIREFLGVRRMPVASDTVLATVLFTDIVGSTELAAQLGDRKWHKLVNEHDRLIRGTASRFRGTELDHAGDGFLIMFDGPARAIRCACTLTAEVQQLGIDVRCGVHTGEAELVDGKLRGIAIHTGARIGALAQPGEVLVSSTVKDLVTGSGLSFRERGVHSLKGVPGDWRLFSIDRT